MLLDERQRVVDAIGYLHAENPGTIEDETDSDPELGRAIRYCAIPRRIDREVIGILRGMPEDFDENERLTTLFCDNLQRYLAEQPLRNVIDKVRGY